MTDVFISYAKADRKRVRPLAKALAAEGFDLWWDQNPQAEGAWTPTLRRALVESAVVITCWSEEAAASSWVVAEAQAGNDRNAFISVLVQDCKMPAAFRAAKSIDMTTWRGDTADIGYQDIVRRVRELIDRRDNAEPNHSAPEMPIARMPEQQQVPQAAHQAAQVAAPSTFFSASLGGPVARAAPTPHNPNQGPATLRPPQPQQRPQAQPAPPQRPVTLRPVQPPPPQPQPPPQPTLRPVEPPPQQSRLRAVPPPAEPPVVQRPPPQPAPPPVQPFARPAEPQPPPRALEPPPAPRAPPPRQPEPARPAALPPLPDSIAASQARPGLKPLPDSLRSRPAPPPPLPSALRTMEPPRIEVPDPPRPPRKKPATAVWATGGVLVAAAAAALFFGGDILRGRTSEPLTAPPPSLTEPDFAELRPQMPVTEEPEIAPEAAAPEESAPELAPAPAPVAAPPEPQPAARTPTPRQPAAQPPQQARTRAPAGQRTPAGPILAERTPALILSTQGGLAAADAPAATPAQEDVTRTLDRCLSRLVRLCPGSEAGRAGFGDDGAISGAERTLLNQRSLFTGVSDATMDRAAANCSRHVNAASGAPRSYQPLIAACRAFPETNVVRQ